MKEITFQRYRVQHKFIRWQKRVSNRVLNKKAATF